jgi:Na+/H+-translocating membrane pyrophosphatase
MHALHVATSQNWLTISSLLVGVLTPAVIAVINHPVWQPQAKRIIAVICAAVLGILTVVANGMFTDFEVTAASVVTVVLAVVGASQTAYALLWKPTGAADKIEETVNPGPSVPEVPGA